MTTSNNNPLHGITLEQILNALVAHYEWLRGWTRERMVRVMVSFRLSPAATGLHPSLKEQRRSEGE